MYKIGIWILQNIRAFDTQCKLETLPHPLPLLPQPVRHSAPFGFTTKKRRMEREARQTALMKSLSDASNRNPDLMKSRLVRSYSQFEKQTILDDFDPVDPIEGRKVRWILIYAIFQTLASVISAPKEVTDTNGSSYPLCCQRPKVMPWMVEGDQSAATTLVASEHTAANSSSITLTSKSSLDPYLVHRSQKSEESSSKTATISKPTIPIRRKHVSFQESVADGYDSGRSQSIGNRPKTPVASSAIGRFDDRNWANKVVNNSSLIRTATSPPPYENPPSPSNCPPSYVATRNFAPSMLPFTTPSPPSRPESPTLPTLPSTPSSSRGSSCNSAFSRITSNTSISSDGPQIDYSIKQDTHTVRAAAVSAPIPIPARKSSAPLNGAEKRVAKPRERPNISAKRSPSSLSSAPGMIAPRKALPQVPPTSVLSTAADADEDLDLPFINGSGRIEMPTALLGSTSNASSNSGVNVIREEMRTI